MARRKAPCTGFEFSIRRSAAGLDNASMIAISKTATAPLRKCSISSLTKWNAGQLPVSRKAYATLVMVEEAIEDEIIRILDDLEEQEDSNLNELVILTPNACWPYGPNTHAVAAARAKGIATLSHGEKVRIRAPAENRSTTPPHLHSTSR